MQSMRKTTEEYFGTRPAGNTLEMVDIPATPEITCADKDQNEIIFHDIDEEITLEAGNEYVNSITKLSMRMMLSSQMVISL